MFSQAPEAMEVGLGTGLGSFGAGIPFGLQSAFLNFPKNELTLGES